MLDLQDYIRDVPDFPKPGVVFKDITPLLRDGQALRHSVDLLASRVEGEQVDAVAGIESRGFLFATALAVRLGKGLIPIRKPNKLPWRTWREDYQLEYGSDAVEVHQDAVQSGQRILLVDDLLATGGTMAAACRLIRKSGGTIVACLFVLELTFLGGARHLGPDTRIQSLIRY